MMHSSAKILSFAKNTDAEWAMQSEVIAFPQAKKDLRYAAYKPKPAQNNVVRIDLYA